MSHTFRVRRIKPRDINHPDGVYDILSRFGEARREHMIMLHMTPGFKAFAYQIVAIGSSSSLTFEMSDLFRKAILLDTKVLCMAHNHPHEEELAPSQEDKKLTRKVFDVGLSLHMPVIDHVIIGPKGYYSFRHNGVIFPKATDYRPTKPFIGMEMKKGGDQPFGITIR